MTIEAFSPAFVWALARVLGAVGVSPMVLGVACGRARWVVAVLLALLLTPCMPALPVPNSVDAGELIWGALTELGVGVAIGLPGALALWAARAAGAWEWSALDRSGEGIEAPLWIDFRAGLAILVFFMTDGPAALIAALRRTFETIPAGQSLSSALRPAALGSCLQGAAEVAAGLVIPGMVALVGASLLTAFIRRVLAPAVSLEDGPWMALLLPAFFLLSLGGAVAWLWQEEVRLQAAWVQAAR